MKVIQKLQELDKLLKYEDCDVAVMCCTHILKTRIQNQVQLDRAARAISALVGETSFCLNDECFAKTAEAAASRCPEISQPCETPKKRP